MLASKVGSKKQYCRDVKFDINVAFCFIQTLAYNYIFTKDFNIKNNNCKSLEKVPTCTAIKKIWPTVGMQRTRITLNLSTIHLRNLAAVLTGWLIS